MDKKCQECQVMTEYRVQQTNLLPWRLANLLVASFRGTCIVCGESMLTQSIILSSHCSHRFVVGIHTQLRQCLSLSSITINHFVNLID